MRLLLALLCFFSSLGCTTAQYLTQATRGQLSLLNRARPVEEVLRDERTPERVKVLLREAPRILEFAARYGLKATKSYRTYVKLDRPYVVWAVTASPQLKLESKLWSFPIVGSFPYLGWFQKEAAESYARKIEAEALAQGEPLDIDVRGAAAYSTLGWFPDPLLSSMIREGDEALGEWVEVLCHESFHATVYVNGQGAWNESLAQFVGEGIAEVYLRENYGESSREFQSYQNSRTRGAKIGVKLQAVYLALQTLYEGALSREEKLQTKSQILQELSAWWEKEFGRARLFNNASLVGYRTYGSGRTEMEEVLRRCRSDWGRLVQALSRIDRESFDRPHQDPFGSVLLKGVGPDCSSPTGR